MALSIAHTAAGAFDAFCAPIPMRVFDMSASLLILAETGGIATDIDRAIRSSALDVQPRDADDAAVLAQRRAARGGAQGSASGQVNFTPADDGLRDPQLRRS